MKRKNHKLFDMIMKILIAVFLSEFLKYIGEKRKIKEILKTEITLMNGKTVLMDFLCQLEDASLLNVEFQFTGPYSKDLNRIYDYNSISKLKYGEIVNTVIVNFRTHLSGEKEIMIEDNIKFSPRHFYLGDIDYEKKIK